MAELVILSSTLHFSIHRQRHQIHHKFIHPMLDRQNLLAKYEVQTYRSERQRQKLLQSEVPEGGTTNSEIKILEKSNVRHKEKAGKFYSKQLSFG